MATASSKYAQAEDTHLVSGGYVPRSGMYTSLHAHGQTASVALLKNNVFPDCKVCGSPVRYAIVSWVGRESASARFRLLMHTKQTLESRGHR